MSPAAARGADDAAPIDIATAAALRAAPATLFVELVVNGQAKGAIASIARDDAHLWIDAANLRDAGVAVRGDGRIDLSAQTDFRATYDAEGQRLLLDVPTALLPTRRITADPREAAQTVTDTGALLNYDLYAQRSNGRTSASLWSEQRVFGDFGTVSNTGVVRVGGAVRGGYVRYDTRYRYIDEGRAQTLTAGDLISQALPWTTAVRIGGVQLARSFRVRPDLVTVPLPSFSGQAAVPSGVDLFVNGYRQQQATVEPGRFVLDSVPVVNGAGQARIVTTDAVGRQIATVIPFYVAPELLRPGLTDYAVEFGALRRGYGLRSFEYGRVVASGSIRRGMTRTFTLEGHGEAARGLTAGGVGAAWAPGLWGAFHGSVALSRGPGRAGRQVAFGYSYASRGFSIGAEHIERSDGYADLGSFDLGRLRGSVRSDRASATVAIAGVGSVGVGYIAARGREAGTTRVASASFSMPLGGRMSGFAAVDYDLDRRAVSAQLRIIVPFGRQAVASAGLSRQGDGATRYQASVATTVPSDGGFGGSADVAIDGRGTRFGQASATWRGRAQQVDIGASTAAGADLVWGSVTGSVALIDGHVFAANRLPDAFAVVSTGMADVPVSYENQAIGRTDRGGRLFVPSVTAWHPARFALDAAALPIGAQAAAFETRVALREGTGAVIRIPVRMTRSVTAHLIDAAGRPIAAGTVARYPGGGTVVGWDGIVLLDDPAPLVALTVAVAGGTCRAAVRVPAGVAMLADLGAVRCE